MSEIVVAQSSKALACIMLLSEAMTLTQQVISSTSSHRLDGATYVIPLGSFGVSSFVSASVCNSEW